MSDGLLLHSRTVGPWAVNAYALICPRSGSSVLIDPGGDPDRLAAMLAASRPIAILVTHSHPDHTGALAEMRRQLAVPVMAHPGTGKSGQPVPVDRPLADGDLIAVGRYRLEVWHTPGHCDDQICFVVESGRMAVVGDTIFEGGPGKTWTSAGFQTTLVTLSEKVLSWSDDTICYPGHGPSFRLGDLRGEIERFTGRDHGDFSGDATWSMGK